MGGAAAARPLLGILHSIHVCLGVGSVLAIAVAQDLIQFILETELALWGSYGLKVW